MRGEGGILILRVILVLIDVGVVPTLVLIGIVLSRIDSGLEIISLILFGTEFGICGSGESLSAICRLIVALNVVLLIGIGLIGAIIVAGSGALWVLLEILIAETLLILVIVEVAEFVLGIVVSVVVLIVLLVVLIGIGI